MSAQDLKALAIGGRLHPSDLVRHGREAAWVPAGRLKGLFAGAALQGGAGQPAARQRPAETVAPLPTAPPRRDEDLPTGSRVPPPPSNVADRPPSARPLKAQDAGGAAVGAPAAAKSNAPGTQLPPIPQPPDRQDASPPESSLEFLEEEYVAPAGFKPPRPKSPIADVLEQKRQRERRNLTILAGVAVGLMLLLGVLMTILLLKQHTPGPATDGPLEPSAPVAVPKEPPPGPSAPAAAADAPRVAARKTVAVPPKASAAEQAAAPKAHPAEKPVQPGGTAAPGRTPGTSKPHGPTRQQAKRHVAADDLPPPTGDPEKDLGISAEMPPPGEPTPWSPLPDPPRKKSP